MDSCKIWLQHCFYMVWISFCNKLGVQHPCHQCVSPLKCWSSTHLYRWGVLDIQVTLCHKVYLTCRNFCSFLLIASLVSSSKEDFIHSKLVQHVKVLYDNKNWIGNLILNCVRIHIFTDLQFNWLIKDIESVRKFRRTLMSKFMTQENLITLKSIFISKEEAFL